jgi:hypothetical protein
VILSSRALLRRRLTRGLLNPAVGGAALLPGAAADAQTEEIQVYDAEINNPGVFSLQLHNNYTPIGRKLPDFMGGIATNHTLNGVSPNGLWASPIGWSSAPVHRCARGPGTGAF